MSLGNLGLNSRIKVSASEPATIYAKDFDNNGSIDAVMCYFIQGKSYPFYAKDDLQDQMPFIKKKYPTMSPMPVRPSQIYFHRGT